MSGRIFINYRRGDDPGFTGRLFDRLGTAFPRGQLFMDVDNISPGHDFVQILESEVGKCDVLLAVIGKGWLDASDESGARRLDNPKDYVRVEIASALEQGKLVIPVLVNNAPMPSADDLPEALKPLARRHAVHLSHDRFASEVKTLVTKLKEAPVRKAQSSGREPDLLSRYPILVFANLGAIAGAIGYGAWDGLPITYSARSILLLPGPMVGLALAAALSLSTAVPRAKALRAGALAAIGWFLGDCIATYPLHSDEDWKAVGTFIDNLAIWGALNGLGIVAGTSLILPEVRSPVVWIITCVVGAISAISLIQFTLVTTGVIQSAATLAAFSLAFWPAKRM
jgi:hypothetical protein